MGRDEYGRYRHYLLIRASAGQPEALRRDNADMVVRGSLEGDAVPGVTRRIETIHRLDDCRTRRTLLDLVADAAEAILDTRRK
jgi:hypothetical protein